MSHYVIGYHDLQNNHYEICEYANDAYTAIKQAKEDLPSYQADPVLLVLLRYMRPLRTHRFRNDCFVGRDNL